MEDLFPDFLGGTFADEVLAAEAYDVADPLVRGTHAVQNLKATGREAQI